MAGERLLLTSAPRTAARIIAAPSARRFTGRVDGGIEAAIAQADVDALAGGEVGGGGDEAAVGALGQAEAALEHPHRRERLAAFRPRLRWRGRRATSAGRMAASSRWRTPPARARCSRMRRWGCARWRRSSAARSSARAAVSRRARTRRPRSTCSSRRCRRSSSRRRGSPRRARAPLERRGGRRAATRPAPGRRVVARAPARRADRPRIGTASSAAADGVGARRSATKSAMVKSVSWPTAEITGTRQATMARATGSSLKAQRSSSEPPPRATMMTSTSAIAARRRSAAAIASAAPSPCTGVGRQQDGDRKAAVRDADDVADDGALRRRHHAQAPRQKGQRPLARRIEQPLGVEPLLELLEGQRQRAGARRLDRRRPTSGTGRALRKASGGPRQRTAIPSSSVNFSRAASRENSTQSSCASSSLRQK